jgi:hypothetical protein
MVLEGTQNPPDVYFDFFFPRWAKGESGETEARRGWEPAWRPLARQGLSKGRNLGLSEQQAGSEGAGRMSRAALHWAPILQVYFRPFRTRSRAFVGRLRDTYVPRAFLMMNPGLRKKSVFPRKCDFLEIQW